MSAGNTLTHNLQRQHQKLREAETHKRESSLGAHRNETLRSTSNVIAWQLVKTEFLFWVEGELFVCCPSLSVGARGNPGPSVSPRADGMLGFVSGPYCLQVDQCFTTTTGGASVKVHSLYLLDQMSSLLPPLPEDCSEFRPLPRQADLAVEEELHRSSCPTATSPTPFAPSTPHHPSPSMRSQVGGAPLDAISVCISVSLRCSVSWTLSLSLFVISFSSHEHLLFLFFPLSFCLFFSDPSLSSFPSSSGCLTD